MSKALIHRSYVISSAYKLFHMKITKFKAIIQENSFPSNLIAKVLNNYLNEVYKPKEIHLHLKKSFIFH